MSALADFQAAFLQALRDPSAAADERVAALVRQPGFAVYRNTVWRGCIDALAANYPAILRLVGDDWFRAAAAVYVRRRPPVQPMLVDYGAGFAEFLETFAPAAELPHLPAVARLDRCFTEAHLAADAQALEPDALAAQLRQAAASAATLRLAPHPAARWHWCDEAPARMIWARNRDLEADDGELAWRAEGTLLTRPRGAVQMQPLARCGVALLAACAAGRPLLQALEAAAEVDPHTAPTLLPSLAAAGAFAAAPAQPDKPPPAATTRRANS